MRREVIVKKLRVDSNLVSLETWLMPNHCVSSASNSGMVEG